MSQIASDNFTRANGPLGSNWTTTEGTWVVSSNTATLTGSSGDFRASTYWSANVFPNDQYSQITIAVLDSTAGEQIGPAVRMASGSETYYWAYPFTVNNNLYIQKLVSGSSTNLTNTPYTPQVGDVVYISAIGTTITATVTRSSSVIVNISTTDSSIASGSAGMADALVVGTNSAVTPWSGGNFISANKHFLPLLGVGA